MRSTFVTSSWMCIALSNSTEPGTPMTYPQRISATRSDGSRTTRSISRRLAIEPVRSGPGDSTLRTLPRPRNCGSTRRPGYCILIGLRPTWPITRTPSAVPELLFAPISNWVVSTACRGSGMRRRVEAPSRGVRLLMECPLLAVSRRFTIDAPDGIHGLSQAHTKIGREPHEREEKRTLASGRRAPPLRSRP